MHREIYFQDVPLRRDRRSRRPAMKAELSSLPARADEAIEAILACRLLAHHVISLRCGIWSLSEQSGLWQAVRPAGFTA
jgi:hypothetical protein